MHELNTKGSYQVPEALLEKIQAQFWGFHCDDVQTCVNIGKCWENHGYLLDPHTATAWAAATSYVADTGDKRPMVILSTASPYKFPAAVLEALRGDMSGDEFQQMERLQALTGVKIPANLAGLQGKPERHTGVINKKDMQEFVLSI